MKKFGLFLMAAVLGLSLAGCGGSSDSEGEAAVQSVSSICGYGSLGTVDRFSGIVASRNQVEIKKSEELTVDSILVSEGDEVTAGQVLFTYDSEAASLDLEKAKLELEQLKNTVSSKAAEIKSLEKEKKSASKDQQLSYTLEIEEAEADQQEAEYNQKVKQKEIEKLEKTMENLEVKAEVDGIVTKINNSSSDDSTDSVYGSSDAFITITETGQYRIKGYVNEMNVGSISEGMNVIIRSRVNDDTWTGTIDSIDWENPATATNSDSYYYSSDSSDTEMNTSSKYPFYVELDSIDGLILGQHVYIEPDYGQEDTEDGQEETIALGSWYINDVDGKAWVWAENKKGKLEKRSVELGEYDEYMDTYVITSGLTLEDYIAYPDDTLTAGMTCTEYDSDYYGDMGGYTDEYTDEEYTDGDYMDEEYTDGDYNDEEYTDEEYTDGDDTEGGSGDPEMESYDGMEETGTEE